MFGWAKKIYIGDSVKSLGMDEKGIEVCKIVNRICKKIGICEKVIINFFFFGGIANTGSLYIIFLLSPFFGIGQVHQSMSYHMENLSLKTPAELGEES